MSRLFTPLKVGDVQLAHRISMAPLTRFRNDDDHSPNNLVKEYYEQRASVPGTLLVSEATLISPRAGSYNNVPGIWTKEHIAGWKAVTDAVHAKKSFIFLQLWHLGRTADPKASAGQEMVSSSAVPVADGATTPKEMTEDDIRQTIEDYATAAKNAIEAGFDGVEIHGANGYLIDQFLQDTCNKRTDGWGGSVEKRARFALEVTRAVVEAVGASRTAIRLSPYSDFQGMLMADPDTTFGHVVDQLKPLGLAYLHLVEARISGNIEADCGGQRSVDWLVRRYAGGGPVMIAGGFTAESAKKAADEHYKDLDVIISFGRLFIPNPDLVFRIEKGLPLEKPNRDTFYVPKSPKGYTDFSFSSEFQASVKAN